MQCVYVMHIFERRDIYFNLEIKLTAKITTVIVKLYYHYNTLQF